MSDLMAIRQRAEAAVPGPWESVEHGVRPEDGPTAFRIVSEEAGTVAFTYGYSKASSDAADFIAHARTDIPDLLDRIKALEGVLMTARTALEQATKVIRVSDGEGHWVHVYKCCRQSFDHGHASDCKRQQALAEIDGVTGAETAEVQP